MGKHNVMCSEVHKLYIQFNLYQASNFFLSCQFVLVIMGSSQTIYTLQEGVLIHW